MENKIVAKVGNIEITENDIMNIMRTIPQNQMAQFATEDGKKSLINEIVARELLYLDAKDNNFEEEDGFKKMLENAKHSLIQQYAVEKLISDIKITEEDTKEFYEKNPQNFGTEEEVRARHILVQDEETARKVTEEIKVGKSFEDAAKEYSSCPSKEKGGDLGPFTKGKMVPEFDEVAFKLEVGELSHIVKTQFGYHLIEVIEKKEATVKSFEEVKNQIIQFLTGQKQNKKYVEHTNKLKETYPVEMM